MVTLQEAFGIRNLNRVVETFAMQKAGELQTYFPEDNIDGEIYEWDQLDFPRDLAPITGPDAPSKNIGELAKSHKLTTLAHVKLNKRIPGRRIFLMERGLGSLRPDAEGHVAREIKDLKFKIDKIKEWLCAKAFTGSIVVNSANIPGTDVTFTITFAVQTFTKTTSWATSTTNILSDANELPKAKNDYSNTVGFPLETAIFNQSVMNYLIGNQEFQAWAQHTNLGLEVMREGRIGRFGGIDWHQYDGNYKPVGGSVTKFIADSKVIFLPSKAEYQQYLVMAQGKGMIPQGAIGSVSDMLMSPAPNSGFYGYATVETDPVVLKVIVGWVGLPIIVYPDVVMYATVA